MIHLLAALVWLPPLWTVICLALVAHKGARYDIGALCGTLAVMSVKSLDRSFQYNLLVSVLGSVLSIVVYCKRVHPRMNGWQQIVVPSMYVGALSYLAYQYPEALVFLFKPTIGSSML